jgi:hypothetical protein
MSQTPWRVAGGPLGAHTSPRVDSVVGWTRLAVLLTALPVLAALALRGWCLANGFGGQAPLWRACYSDLPTALVAIRSGTGAGEPVVTAAASVLVALPVRGTAAGDQSAYVVLWALVSLVALAVMVAAVAAYRSDRPDRALLLVLCPALPLLLLVSADIVGVTLMVLGLLAWQRRHDRAAGVLLSLAVASAALAVVALAVVLVLTWRSGRSLRRLGVGLAGGALVVAVLTASLGWDVAAEPVRQWWSAVPSYGSVWLLPGAAGAELPSGLAPWTTLGAGVVAVVLVVLAVRRGATAPGVADLTLLGVAAVLVLSPAVPVQASLWLVPLVALSSLPWRDMLLWAGAEILYYPMVWLYIGGLQSPDRGLPAGWYAFFLLLRLAAIGYLGYRAWVLGAHASATALPAQRLKAEADPAHATRPG